MEFASKVIKIDENFNVKMTIWDTAGQESFKSIIRSYYRNSSAVFLVYDITKYPRPHAARTPSSPSATGSPRPTRTRPRTS